MGIVEWIIGIIAMLGAFALGLVVGASLNPNLTDVLNVLRLAGLLK